MSCAVSRWWAHCYAATSRKLLHFRLSFQAGLWAWSCAVEVGAAEHVLRVTGALTVAGHARLALACACLMVGGPLSRCRCMRHRRRRRRSEGTAR